MDVVNKISKISHARLVDLGYKSLNLKTVQSIIRIVHTASLITEEGQFIQGSITFSNPIKPDNPPYLQRADYPKFTAFHKAVKLTPEFFVKIARAVDKWSGSIAVWGEKPSKIVAWGIVDQLVETNKHLNREHVGGFPNPGIFTVKIDRPGDFTIYHEDIFLGSIRAQRLVLSESEILDSKIIADKLIPTYEKLGAAICSTVSKVSPNPVEEQVILNDLINSWKTTVARVCIGLQRLRTGGTLIITDSQNLKMFSISHNFYYDRLSSALVLQVLDKTYENSLTENYLKSQTRLIKRAEVIELNMAEQDSKDRADEVTGAVKLVTSLAAMDGVLLLKPDLSVIGFGAKIEAGSDCVEVYDADDFEKHGKNAKRFDNSSLGTRHNSLFRYCAKDENAIGVVISQDGHVKVVTNINGKIIFWNRIQLLNHRNFSKDVLKEAKRHKRNVGTRNVSKTFGYSQMPKSVPDLLAGKNSN